MTFKLDDVCKKILISLSITPIRLAQLLRDTGIGSARTVDRHLNHLVEAGLVKDEKEVIGVKKYRKISLTEKGLKEKERIINSEIKLPISNRDDRNDGKRGME